MANIFTDLNKLVNTVQKVDKLLTEKPKRTRTKSVQLTTEEKNYILFLLKNEEQNWMGVSDDEFYFQRSETIKTLRNKLK
jgi:hypothetical protein